MMRLHDMSGPAALETLCGIIDPASVILEDCKTADALAYCVKAMEKPNGAKKVCWKTASVTPRSLARAIMSLASA